MNLREIAGERSPWALQKKLQQQNKIIQQLEAENQWLKEQLNLAAKQETKQNFLKKLLNHPANHTRILR